MIEVLAARGSWCAPNEKILWCQPLTQRAGKFIHYAVPGLNDFGDPRKASRMMAEAAVGVAALLVESLVSPGSDGTSDPDVPWAVVSGKSRDCLAVSYLASWHASGGNSSSRGDQELFWMLTTHRLGLLDFSPWSDGQDSSSSGLLVGLKKTIGSVWDRDEDPHADQEPELPAFRVCAEVPRNAIASVEVVEQKIKGRTRHWFKIVLTDGSVFFLSDPKYFHDKKFFDRMLAMTYGQE
ncbi:hypothetical protein GCM10011581_49250 [Saccharopolyspora subtropica]|uniref:Uncharacterized protein n=1 Tax=Saccharopolyspora thermophila TaxID=89367 RepID=A0A917KBF1_9PSEU|nr:hypothetical protein [Saccharopolyspora subtropica]GGJ06469.1 hypothetical protein GCM10011581_49250 [Saccharopolyspora subtropica]